MAIETTYTHARANLKALLDEVSEIESRSSSTVVEVTMSR